MKRTKTKKKAGMNKETKLPSPDVADRLSPTSIQVSDLHVTAGARVLLDSANATFAAGEVTLIVGPSGVGKSILMRLMAGLTRSFGKAIRYRGEVSIDGEKTRSGQAGVVFSVVRSV